MGYTHYFHIRDEKSPEWRAAWPQLIHDAQRIIDNAYVPLTGPTDDDNEATPPIVDKKKGIYLNGVGEDAHEPLVIQGRKYGSFGLTNTARKPYDAVVCCILLRAFMSAPGQFTVRSDGDWDDWSLARMQYEYLWPDEPLRCPWEEQEDVGVTLKPKGFCGWGSFCGACTMS
ncbi:hypothetical protein BO78DRAFT_431058 [Aspergillus sclerotiicarbonarius CBS 121057]|uniref:Uncharacterized protein n=1 Tax=Aspergillus sclerotiicarbonarius (strain CBS 121057 / IBT 28362) TaxID=1448318 RepID=A0A319E3T8_ASPSB|nr:hypothetical protein BO78DRAFT_431058 [Aspergillus sclerotiicarbonarius CBS 121057]